MRSERINKYACLSLLIGPLLEPYYFPGTRLAIYKILMLLNVFLFFKHKGASLFIPRYYKWFLIYAFTIPTMNALFHNYMSHLLGSYLTLMLFSANLVLLAPFVDLDRFIKYYRIFGIITCAIFFAQEISFLLYGSRFMALIPFLDVHYEGFSTEEFSDKMSMLDRSCSCFLEPSHFAQYVLPLLAFELGSLHERNRSLAFVPIVLSIVLLILRSGVGLLCGAALWCVFILFSRRSLAVKTFVILPLVSILALVFFISYSNTEKGAAVVDRAVQLNPNNNNELSSGIIRVYRGYMVYDTLDLPAQLLGVGVGGANDAIDNSSYNWMFEEGDHYLNNIQTLLIGYGIIGTFIFMLFLLSMIRTKSFVSVLFVVAFLSTSLLESYFCAYRMLFFLGIPFVISSHSYVKSEKNETLVTKGNATSLAK